MIQIVLATENAGKVLEMRELLAELAADFVTSRQVGLNLNVREDGTTYAENAALKARAHAAASGRIALADDSGLEVDALNGEPGLYSARYAPGEAPSDADRRRYLLSRLQGSPRPWTAHFHCTVAIAVPGGEVFFAEGNCPGEIIPEERGQNGFGYDPIFLLPDLGLTMAELSMEEKNQRSHRALAVKAALPILKGLMGT